MASDSAHETSNGQRLAAFVRWLEDNGADLSRIEVREAGAGGNGVYARRDIAEDERYAYIPHKLVITGKVCLQTLGSSGLEGRALLAAFLVHERFVAENSFWKPYIGILPENYHTPLEFGERELALLEGTPIEHAVKDRRSKYAEEHSAALRATAGIMSSEVLTLENYVWAASAVSSRAFSKELVQGLDEQTASSEVMLPLLDMMNHQPRRRVSWVALDSGIEFVTGSELKSGDQVFNNYGPKSNEELLMGYGFCVPGNPFSHFHIKLNYEKDPQYEDKRELLEAAGITSCDQFIRADELPRDLLPMLRVMAMTDVDVHYAQKRLRKEGKSWDVRRSLEYVGLHNELRARHLLLFLVQKKLEVFEQVEAQLADDPETENARVARVYRDEIGAILRATVRRLALDKQRLMAFACDLQPLTQTSMPWYARASDDDVAFVKPPTAEESADAPTPKRARTSSSASEDPESDELEHRFLTTALITADSFALDEEFLEAISQVDVDSDVMLTLFVIRVMTTAGLLPWHEAVGRLEKTFRHPMMSVEDLDCVEMYGEMLVEMGEIYDSLFPLLSEHFPEVFPIDSFTAERFVWAAALVESFRVEVPVAGQQGSVVDAVCLL
ncbi:hypothetical protein LPJ56_000656 [Coemansia sp. RSA 2599]|nr:hypothetical protein LPJ75_000364 [Coemansia sp. RSA 2598]KAJ1829056.1 hypothetical protein LPJ56_000656 [Coemansia sp. RSA 2599]